MSHCYVLWCKYQQETDGLSEMVGENTLIFNVLCLYNGHVLKCRIGDK